MALPILFRPTQRRRTRGSTPLLTLSSEMDHLFEDLWRGHTGARKPSAYAPRIDLVESEEELRVSAELPGISADALHVEVKDGVLRIRGEKAASHEEGEKIGWHRAERSYGAFERSVRIPVEVDLENVTATHRDGVLEIALPKATSAKTREIPVEVGSSSS